MGLINKITDIVKGGSHTSDEWNTDTKNMEKMQGIVIPTPEFEIVDVSDNVYLLNRSGRVCVGMLPDGGYDKQKGYCSRMGSRGHESPFEHTNAIAIIKIPSYTSFTTNYMKYVTEFLSYTKYCKVSIKEQSNLSIMILISGSARAFGHIIQECSEENPFVQTVKNIMYASFEKEILSKYIEEGILDEELCVYEPEVATKEIISAVTQHRYEYEKLESPNNYDTVAEEYQPITEELDSNTVTFLHRKDKYLEKIFNHIKVYRFDIKDLFKVSTMSFVFHDISRACANQMTRHRVAISQESQRYVKHQTDLSQFINPLDTNPGRYADLDPSTVDYIRNIDPFGNYKYALDNKIVKEDARAWLPMNVTTKVMMTFTIEQLAHFINIRSDMAAQKEVQLVTEGLVKHLIDELNYNFLINEDEQFPDIFSRIAFIALTPNNKDISNRFDLDTIFLSDSNTSNGVDEDLGEEVEITDMEVKTIDDAKDILEKAEKYKQLENESDKEEN